jgi:flagellar basal-body rod protein FlgC
MKVGSSFNPIDISVSGLRAQAKRMETISSNVSNAQTTDDGSGEPYRQLEAVFRSDGGKGGIGGVSLDEITANMSQFPKILKPGHPDADENGYVSMPNVSMPQEMMNLTIASRAYQANTAVLKRYQTMVDTTLELLK